MSLNNRSQTLDGLHEPSQAVVPPFGSRRRFLRQAGMGFGSLALAGLLDAESPAGAKANALSGNGPSNGIGPLSPKPGHFSGAKSVIWLFMHGAPSQVDTWDYKPELAKRNGQELKGFDQSTGFFAGLGGPIMRSPFQFKQHGESGTWVSDIFPEMARHVDEMAFIHSCHAAQNNHAPAQFEINSGMSRMGFPCLGSWLVYGLGSENQNLPGFIVMYDTRGRGTPKSRASAWSAGFLPPVFQGTAVKQSGTPIANLNRPAELTAKSQVKQLDLVRQLNALQQKRSAYSPELEARIESFELAFRMQAAAPEAFDLSQETEATHELYGLNDQHCQHFGRQCLNARRLVERGVRFIQLYSGGFNNEDCWDGHTNIDKNHRQFAGETDRPIAGLLQDLKQRGLLESTLVIWCGEFGRLPLVQKGGTGRDHNPHAFTCWMAGGSVKKGAHYGATDELGNRVVENRVSVNDLHATILHLMGLDHQRLTYKHNGRDFRLTDISGTVVDGVIDRRA